MNMYSHCPSEKKICLGLFFGVVLWCLGGCGPGREEIVQAKVSERVNTYRIKKTAECRETLLREAGKAADSLLLAEARQELVDSLSRMKPGRPAKPIPVLPIDSLQIKPLFDQ